MILVIAAVTANQAGLVKLIAEGYGTVAWAFFAIYFIPLITIGTRKLLKASKSPTLTTP